MKIIIDTHVLLWIITGRSELSVPAREAYLDITNSLYFSIVGYWEICIKISVGKLRLSPGWQQMIKQELRRNGISWLSLLPGHCECVTNLPWIHRDPFDRLMIAQALEEKAVVLTADENIHRYEVESIW